MKKVAILMISLSLFAYKETVKKDKIAQQDTATTEIQDQEWIPLFDGSTMDNWRGYNMDSMPKGWAIEDGTLSYTPGHEGRNDIITKEKFENFELSIEWKISKNGNSGIFWSVVESDTLGIYQSGIEIQVLDDEGHPDAKNGASHQAGALYDLVSPAAKVVNPAEEWNLCTININHKTNKGVATLNGTVTAEFSLQGEDWDKMVADSKFKGWTSFGTHHNGHIGLQDHGNKVWFRNIKIKKLK